MRKHRTWWMGLGIGMILGASMLQLMHFAETQSNAFTLVEEVKKYSQKELDDKIAKAVAEARKTALPDPSETPQASVKPDPETSPSGSPSPSPPAASASPSATPSSSPEAGQEVAFYINTGMDLKTVARSLKRLGVIEDAEDFTDEARTVSKKIKPGTSRFKGKPTYEEIMAELTRTKDD